MAAADAEVTGRLGAYLAPDRQFFPGRRAMLFCDAEDMLSGSPRAYLLPATPPEARQDGGHRSGIVAPRIAEGDCHAVLLETRLHDEDRRSDEQAGE